MKFWDKIKQIFLQILLLPVSFWIELTGGFCIWGTLLCIVVGFASIFTEPSGFALILLCLIMCLLMGFYVWHHLAKPFTYLILKIKNTSCYNDYTDSGAWYTSMESVRHEITDTSGTVVGYYESTEPVEHYDMSDEEFKERCLYILYCSVALPCRIISLLLSILALFTNKFFVSVRQPVHCTFNTTAHKYFDLIIPRYNR